MVTRKLLVLLGDYNYEIIDDIHGKIETGEIGGAGDVHYILRDIPGIYRVSYHGDATMNMERVQEIAADWEVGFRDMRG